MGPPCFENFAFCSLPLFLAFNNFNFLKTVLNRNLWIAFSISADCIHKENWCNGNAFSCNGTYLNHIFTCEDFYDNLNGDDTCIPGKSLAIHMTFKGLKQTVQDI